MKKNLKYSIFVFINITIIALCILFTQVQIPRIDAYAIQNTYNNTVYLGGTPIGIISESNGLIVSEIVNITNKNGSFSPALHAGFKKGDIIISINDEKTSDINKLNDVIQNSKGTLNITVLRNNEHIKLYVEPVVDNIHNIKKIGLILKNNIAGIGTLTYVRKDYRYGALGHAIVDSYGNSFLYNKGKIFLCDISGYNRATKDIPGELLGKINMNYPSIGTLDKNKFCGIFGKFTNIECLPKKTIQLGNKSSVTPGKAFIYTSISSNAPELYEIEIIKASKQNQCEEKGMVIRVTDKKLLNTTGGILQGMSGSPIIQNNKLIGAVTHVFTNDTTTGYGIYIDWMINE